MDNQRASVFTQQFTVRSYEVHPGGRATLSTICNYLQEAAGRHALELDYDITQLQEQKLTWVLYQLHMDLEHYPRRWSRVTLETWPSGGEGVRAHRDFVLSDENGNTLGKALTQWMILDLQTKRPIRIPEEVIKMQVSERDHVLPVEKERLEGPKLDNGEYSESKLTVQRSDLDMNGHVNNVRYIEWIMESVPWEVYQHKQLQELRVIFRAEGNLNDIIRSITKPTSEGNSGTYEHVILRNKSNKKLALAQTRWR